MQNPTQYCSACVHQRWYFRRLNGRNVCVLGIALSDEQQENTDKSRHDGNEEKLASSISIIEHSICQRCDVKTVDYQPVAEMLGRFRPTQYEVLSLKQRMNVTIIAGLAQNRIEQ